MSHPCSFDYYGKQFVFRQCKKGREEAIDVYIQAPVMARGNNYPKNIFLKDHNKQKDDDYCILTGNYELGRSIATPIHEYGWLVETFFVTEQIHRILQWAPMQVRVFLWFLSLLGIAVLSMPNLYSTLNNRGSQTCRIPPCFFLLPSWRGNERVLILVIATSSS